MNDDKRKQQEALHLAIEECLGDDIEGRLLTGWIVIFETTSMSDQDDNTCGHLYGPTGMRTWRALGLVEWVRRFCLRPDDDGDEDDPL